VSGELVSVRHVGRGSRRRVAQSPWQQRLLRASRCLWHGARDNLTSERIHVCPSDSSLRSAAPQQLAGLGICTAVSRKPDPRCRAPPERQPDLQHAVWG